MACLIRAAGAGDAPAIAALWNALIRDSTVTFARTERTQAEVAALVAARRREGHAFLVAETPAGFAGFATYAQFRAGDGYDRCMEHSVHLLPDVRGRGIGRALMAAIEDHARRRGVHAMIAGVSGENAAGLAFHAALGYRSVARVPEAGHKFGRWLDLVLMQKFLD